MPTEVFVISKHYDFEGSALLEIAADLETAKIVAEGHLAHEDTDDVEEWQDQQFVYGAYLRLRINSWSEFNIEKHVVIA